MTFCPWPLFKNQGFHYTSEGFKKNSFDLEEIFHPQGMEDLKNETLFLIKTTWTMFYGQCFTIITKAIF